MYGWVWRRLPGGAVTKTMLAVLLAAAGAALLWFVIFPWVAPLLPLDRVMPGALPETG